MNTIFRFFPIWHFSQTTLKRTLRWSTYVNYEKNGKHSRYNKIRRQDVLQHTISKLVVFAMIMPSLKSIFYNEEINFELLWFCILIHDFAEPLRKEKFDILAGDKVHSDDVDEYLMLKAFLDKSSIGNEELLLIEKTFLLQFSLTSYESFPEEAKELMQQIRENEVEYNTALLFQIIEKWEYHFYAYEHKNKHPRIWNDVSSRQSPILEGWINKYPKKYRNSLNDLFAIKILE